jgi:hypothetical protein
MHGNVNTEVRFGKPDRDDHRTTTADGASAPRPHHRRVQEI